MTIQTNDPVALAYPVCGVGQIPDELERVRKIYRQKKPKAVLEIGCWYGGTLCEWLTLGKPEKVVAVDTAHLNPNQYEEWRDPSTELAVITGRSQDPYVRQEIAAHGPFDWIFIDGDHGPSAVAEDASFARSVAAPSALILLHDIDPPGYGPWHVLQALAGEGLRTLSIVEPAEGTGYPDDSAHGIGVVYL